MAAILGITDGDDSGAALLVDGRLVAAVNEERLNRVKMTVGFPRQSIHAVLHQAGLHGGDIDAVVFAAQSEIYQPQPRPNDGWFRDRPLRKVWNQLTARLAKPLGRLPGMRSAHRVAKTWSLGPRRTGGRILLSELGVAAPVSYVDHHRCHALAAFDAAGFDDALVVTLDGGGDGSSSKVYRGTPHGLTELHAIDSMHSLGNFYAYVTHLCGFKAGLHEGKITGLAAHGEPRYVDLFDRLIHHDRGTLVNRGQVYYQGAIRALRAGLPPEWTAADLAASVQQHLEHTATAYIAHWQKRTGAHRICLAGGVFANVRLNQCIASLPGVEEIFVFPAMGDGGLATGAAYAGWRGLSPHHRPAALDHVYLGPTFDRAALESAARRSGLPYRAEADIAAVLAQRLHDGQVVARFDGPMEYGPRALGNRSILFNGRDVTVNDWLNRRLHRTEFMPFAPACMAGCEAEWFEWLPAVARTARFMTVTVGCRPGLREACPAVVHIDGTARPQIVDAATNPGFHAVLRAYGERSGVPVLINTSFNMHEEPIVCSPEDALRAFVSSRLDALALGPFLVEQRPEHAAVTGR